MASILRISRWTAVLLAGALVGLAWVLMLTYVLVFIGTEGLDVVKETIKSFL